MVDHVRQSPTILTPIELEVSSARWDRRSWQLAAPLACWENWDRRSPIRRGHDPILLLILLCLYEPVYCTFC